MIDFIVTAVPERADYVAYLQRHIPGLIVVEDRQKNAMANFQRAWKEHPSKPSIRLQDDIVLCVDFVTKALAAVKARPEAVIRFFSRSKYDISEGSRWRPGREWMMNQCYYLPAGVSGLLYAYSLTWPKMAEHPNGDDALMADFFNFHRVKFWTHVPSLVDHAPIPSAIDSRRSKKRQSTTFEGPELDGYPLAHLWR